MMYADIKTQQPVVEQYAELARTRGVIMQDSMHEFASRVQNLMDESACASSPPNSVLPAFDDNSTWAGLSSVLQLDTGRHPRPARTNS